MMKFKDSRDSVSSELLLWKESATQVSIKSVYDLKVHPISSLYNEGAIQFSLPPQSRGMLTNIDIVSTFKVLKNGKSNLEDNDNCTIINNISNALWEMVQVELGDRVSITQSMRNSYAYHTFFNNCFNTDPNRSSYQFATELWKMDSGDTKEDSEVAIFAGDGVKNKGAAARSKRIWGSKSNTVRSRLHVPLFNSSKAFPTNMNIRISLTRNNDQFLILADQDSYRVQIDDVHLIATYINPHDVFLSMIEERLIKQPAPFFISRPELIIKPIGHAGRNVILNNLFPGQLPPLAYFCIQRSQDFQGHYQKNPWTFVPFSKFQLTIDGIPYFPGPLEITPEVIGGKRYYNDNRSFLEQLYRTTGHHNRGCNLINSDNFQQNFIVGVSLSGDRAPSSASYLNPQKEASTQLEIDIGYDVNVSDELILVIYAVYNRLVTISSDRSVQVFD